MSASVNLLPSRAVELARTLTRAELTARDDGRAILLVRVGGEGQELVEGLKQLYGPTAPEAATVPVLDFHTVMADPQELQPSPSDAAQSHFDLVDLQRWVRGAECFPIAIVKRDSSFGDRISIGRATNKDVSLRSGSVSKLHGWFEWGEDGVLRIADAGSKNGTVLDGTPLPPREPRPVPFGAPLRLGRLSTIVCPAELFWQLARAA